MYYPATTVERRFAMQRCVQIPARTELQSNDGFGIFGHFRATMNGIALEHAVLSRQAIARIANASCSMPLRPHHQALLR